MRGEVGSARERNIIPPSYNVDWPSCLSLLFSLEQQMNMYRSRPKVDSTIDLKCKSLRKKNESMLTRLEKFEFFFFGRVETRENVNDDSHCEIHQQHNGE